MFAKVWRIVDRHPWLRFLVGLIGLGATYLEYATTGHSKVFWILFGLTLVAFVLAALKAVGEKSWRLWRRRGRLRKTAKILSLLIQGCRLAQKAFRLQDRVDSGDMIRAVLILPVEGKLGVVLNAGKEDNLLAGTQLILYRTDKQTPDGEQIEELLGLIEVTYVQANGNLSQAIVRQGSGAGYWSEAETLVKAEGKLVPPSNFAVPHVPLELSKVPGGDLVNFSRCLEATVKAIRESLAEGRSNHVR